MRRDRKERNSRESRARERERGQWQRQLETERLIFDSSTSLLLTGARAETQITLLYLRYVIMRMIQDAKKESVGGGVKYIYIYIKKKENTRREKAEREGKG